MVNQEVTTKILQKSSKYDKFIFNNVYVDLFSYSLISMVLWGSAKIYFSLDDLMAEVKEKGKHYKFSTYYDLTPSLLFFVILVISHKLFNNLVAPRMENYLNKRYANEEKTMIEVYKKKSATYIFKLMFYTFSSVFGFLVLKEMKSFPTSMLGKGHFSRFFEGGYPNFVYFDRPEYFDMYYNLNLSFALFDGWLLITSPLQSDFLIMVLHHISTYSLIVFSFMSNYSNFGSIIYFTHFLGDVFSYIVRASVHLNVPDRFVGISTLVFLVVFIYTRLYICSDLFYHYYYGLDIPWTIIETYQIGFFFTIMLLNIFWVFMVTKKLIKYWITGDIQEIYKFKLNKPKNE